MKNQIILQATALLLVSLLTGCASVTGTTAQSVSVQTREQAGKEVAGASCEMTNNKGTWFVTTPGSVSIHRSNDDLQVTCKKEGLEVGRAAVVSDTKGSMFGNILLGGGIGAIVDHNNGSAYEYPTLIQVMMGTTTKIMSPKKEQPDNQNPMTGASASNVQTNHSAETRVKLKELKNLYDQGLISQDVYTERQRKLVGN